MWPRSPCRPRSGRTGACHARETRTYTAARLGIGRRDGVDRVEAWCEGVQGARELQAAQGGRTRGTGTSRMTCGMLTGLHLGDLALGMKMEHQQSLCEELFGGADGAERAAGLSLDVHWIELKSLSRELQACATTWATSSSSRCASAHVQAPQAPAKRARLAQEPFPRQGGT